MARDLISSDATIRAIKLEQGIRRLSDGGGLYLLLFVKGGSHGWRLDYSHAGKRKTLSLGTYPSVGLAAARRVADTYRQMIAAGVDPSDERKATKIAQVEKLEDEARVEAGLPARGSFEDVARDWFAVKQGEWAASYSDKVIRRLEVDVFPHIGGLAIAQIKPPQVLQMLRKIEERQVIETAHRALESCSQVFRFAVANGYAESNPARDLKGSLKRPVSEHFAAITDPARFGELLRAMDGYAGTSVVRAALALAPMLLLRPGELRFADWSEIDLDSATWTVPASRMKRTKVGKESGGPHLVPLPRQAVRALRDLYRITGPKGMVFRGERHHDRAMSENTVNAALRAMGFDADEVTGHGFRASARTMLDEQLGYETSVIEAQLAHSVKDSLGRAYNRTTFLEQRRKMMQGWANYLDKLRRASGGRPTRRTTAA